MHGSEREAPVSGAVAGKSCLERRAPENCAKALRAAWPRGPNWCAFPWPSAVTSFAAARQREYHFRRSSSQSSFGSLPVSSLLTS
jgi:hypothetical protein